MQVNDKNILIIVGSASCVADDIAACLSTVHDPLSTISVMLIGLDSVEKYLGHAAYFATYHPCDIDPANERRQAAGGNTDYIIIAHQQYDENRVDMILPCEPPSGSSALLGVLAGIKLGYKKIIVCGCPLIGTNASQYDYANFQKGWTAKLDQIKGVTRSMSGWTKELLGAPTEEWLAASIKF